MKHAGLVLVAIVAVAAMNYLLADLCNPQSLWAMRDIFGLDVGKGCGR